MNCGQKINIRFKNLFLGTSWERHHPYLISEIYFLNKIVHVDLTSTPNGHDSLWHIEMKKADWSIFEPLNSFHHVNVGCKRMGMCICCPQRTLYDIPEFFGDFLLITWYLWKVTSRDRARWPVGSVTLAISNGHGVNKNSSKYHVIRAWKSSADFLSTNDAPCHSQNVRDKS